MEVKLIPIREITTFDVKLREVEKESADYKELVSSIVKEGILNAISVVPSENGEFKYILVDGLHRLTAAADAGLEVIPATIQDATLTKSQILVKQLVANSHKIDTKPAQFAAQLQRIMVANPLMTRADLANMVSRSEAFVDQYLKLNEIKDDTINQMIDSGDIKVSNAHALAALAKVAPEELENYVDKAVTMPAGEFMPMLEARIKEIQANKRKGKGKSEASFQMIPRPRPPKILRDLYTDIPAALKLVDGAQSVEEAIKMLLAWLVRCDAKSEEEARAQYDAEKAARAAARESKSVEKAEENLKKAQEIYAKLKAEEEAAAK